MQDNKKPLLISVYFGSLFCFIATFFSSLLLKGGDADFFLIASNILMFVSLLVHLFCFGKMVYLYFKK